MTTGKLQRVTLGKWPDMSVAEARKEATNALSVLAKGIKPIEEKRKQRLRGITLQELLSKYLADKTDLREASILDYTKKINQGFSDWLNKLCLSGLHPSQLGVVCQPSGHAMGSYDNRCSATG
jgi:hypothetical protein